VDVVSLALSKGYTNEKLNSLPSNAPTKTVTFDGEIYSVGSDVVNGQVSVVVKGNTRQNLLTENQSSGEIDTTGFISKTVTGVTIIRDTTEKYFGSASIKVSTSGSVKNQDVCVNNVKGTIGKKYVGSVYVKAPLGATMEILLRREATQNITIKQFVGTDFWERIHTTLTLDADTSDLGLWIRTDSNPQAITFYVDGLMIEETNELKPFILGGSTKSTNSVRIKSVGKNLFDKRKAVLNHRINVNTGALSSRSDYFATDFIPVDSGDNYYRNIVYTTAIGDNYAFYDQNKKFLYAITNPESYVKVIAIPQDVKYIRMGARMTDLDIYYFTKGSVATPYEPYKESIVNVNLPEPLRSVPSAKDEINVTKGIRTQRLGQHVIQSADIEGQNFGNTTSASFYTKIKEDFIPDSVVFINAIQGNLLFENLSHFTEIAADTSTAPENTFYTYGTNQRIYFQFPLGTTLAEARTALAGTALTYQLATPIVTKLPAQAPLQVFENGTVYVEPIGDVSESTLPSVEMTIPIGTSNKFGVATHDYGGAAADWILTKNEANCGILIVTNAGGAANIIAPNDLGRFFFVKNDSGYDVVVKSAGAEAGTTIADGNSVIVFNTGD
jgi:hypothetical protein